MSLWIRGKADRGRVPIYTVSVPLEILPMLILLLLGLLITLVRKFL